MIHFAIEEITPRLCATFVNCLYDFQTLLSGVIAIIGAVVTAIVIWKAARLPTQKQIEDAQEQNRKRRRYVCSVLETELKRLSNRARQAVATITVVKAANAQINEETKRKVWLATPSVVDDRECMSVLTAALLDQPMRLGNDVADHNFDVDRAGGVFEDDNFGNQMKNRLGRIEATSQALANRASSERK
jgi:hypothetical protein